MWHRKITINFLGNKPEDCEKVDGELFKRLVDETLPLLKLNMALEDCDIIWEINEGKIDITCL